MESPPLSTHLCLLPISPNAAVTRISEKLTSKSPAEQNIRPSIRRTGLARVLIHQDVLSHSRVKERFLRPHGLLFESLGLWCRVAVERRIIRSAAPGQKPTLITS